MAKSKILKGSKSIHECVGGPYTGMKLWLSTPHTLVFTAKGMTGRYASRGLTNLYWEAS